MQFTYTIRGPQMLRTFLQEQGYSKNTISAIKHNGALIVNGQTETVRKQLQKDDIVEVHLARETASHNLVPFEKTLNVLYEDEYLLIVSKEANQNCAPSREHKHFSLVEQILGYFKQSRQNIVPHIVTRIDRNTSGIVVVAKHGFLHHLMSNIHIDKTYLCVCFGEMKSHGIIDAPIARDPSSIITRQVNSHGKQAITKYRRLDHVTNYSLCEIALLTGRTHQIRVHFQHIGHPIVGDDLYGGGHSCYKHQLLRCFKISFMHPIYDKKIEIQDRYDAIENIFNMI